MTLRSTAATALALAAVAVAAAVTAGCGEATERIGDTADRFAPPTPRSPAPTPVATPSTAPATANKLVLAGDVAFEDADPEVVITTSPAGERIQVELRHRETGSAAPDSTLFFLEVPTKAGTYAVHPPSTPPVAGRVSAFLTSRTERVGTMKDFTDSVRGTLTLREETPGVIAGTFVVVARQAPPPPPVILPGVPTPAPSVGTMPTPPPAQVQASGSFVALLSSARAATPAPPPPPTPAATPAPGREASAAPAAPGR